MSHITQVYAKAPDRASLDADLLEQGLAAQDEDGNVNPRIGVTVWTPLEQEDDPATDTDESVEASYVLALVGWTENSRKQAGLSQEEVNQLLTAGTLSNGTEIDIDISTLSLSGQEPRYKTYGA